MNDMMKKGRYTKNVKLRIEDVQFIRNHYRKVGNQSNASALAVKFNVCENHIRLIIVGKRWRFLI